VANVKCPRCGAGIDAAPDELGFIVCSSCGAKLRTKTGMKVSVQGAAGAAPSPAPFLPRIDPARAAPADVDSVLARLDAAPNPNETLRPGAPVPKIARPAPAAASAPAPVPAAATLEGVLAEIRAVRQAQDEILSLLRSGAAASPASRRAEEPASAGDDEGLAAAASPARAHKTVLLIDDDPQTRRDAVMALQAASVAVKTAVDGNGGLAAIAMEKPDAIVLELAMGGSMPGKDVVNLIKATMEWVDIPIVLYTRTPVEDDEEARLIHGADLIVPKKPGSAQVLAARVSTLLRR
jgi:CheY-like chemotaxis protein